MNFYLRTAMRVVGFGIFCAADRLPEFVMDALFGAEEEFEFKGTTTP